MWWNIVNTMPGRGTPRDALNLGGGYHDGEPVPGRIPPRSEWGEAWDFDYEDALYGGETSVYLRPREHDGARRAGGRTGTRTSAEASTRTRTSSTYR
ncbi:MAG: hypothetical protein M5U19_18415 [Microthrixaceae bacterium]|nr:hypothetical protein [Microthrixaceae bacterium]